MFPTHNIHTPTHVAILPQLILNSVFWWNAIYSRIQSMNLVRLYFVIRFWVFCFLSFIALFCPYWNSNMLPGLFYIPQVCSLTGMPSSYCLSVLFLSFRTESLGFLHHSQSFNFLIAVITWLCNIRTCMKASHEDQVQWVSLDSSWINSSLLPLTWEWMWLVFNWMVSP